MFEIYDIITVSTTLVLSPILLIVTLLVVIYLHSVAMIKDKKITAKIKEYESGISNISKYSQLSFALYNTNGIREKIIINGEERDNTLTLGGMLCVNLFENPFDGTTADVIRSLKPGQSVNNQIDTFLNKYADFMDHDGANSENAAHIFKYIIKRTKENKYPYIVVAVNITGIESNEDAQEEIEKMLRTASANSNVGVASYSLEGNIEFATGSWFKNLGITSSVNKPHGKFQNADPIDFKKITEYTSRAAKDPAPGFKIPPLVTDIRVRMPDGSSRWTMVNIFKSDSSTSNAACLPSFIDLNMDITDLKEKEVRLAELNKKAKEAERETDNFLNSISHEVRTPLNSIVGFTELYVNTDDIAQREEFIPVIKQNNILLSNLLDNILSISSYSGGLIKPDKKELHLNGFIEDMKVNAAEQVYAIKDILRKNLYINIEIPKEDLVINTDRELLSKAMTNLISNGLKFTERGGITIGYVPAEGGGAKLFVRDTGIGVESNDIKKIFEPFEKVDTFTQGLGLGLTICKSILQLLNSELEMQTYPQKGSTFGFIIK